MSPAFEELPADYVPDMRRLFSEAGDAESEIGAALAVLQEHALQHRKSVPGSMDTWSRIEISPDIALSVRGVTEDDAGLLERVANKLRRLISRHRKESR